MNFIFSYVQNYLKSAEDFYATKTNFQKRRCCEFSAIDLNNSLVFLDLMQKWDLQSSAEAIIDGYCIRKKIEVFSSIQALMRNAVRRSVVKRCTALRLQTKNILR